MSNDETGSKRSTLNTERPISNSESLSVGPWTACSRKSASRTDSSRGELSELGVRRFLLHLIPNAIHLLERNFAKFLALGAQLILQSIEARHEFVGRSLQCAFCVELAFARQVNDRKKKIADFVFDCLSIFARDCLLQF